MFRTCQQILHNTRNRTFPSHHSFVWNNTFHRKRNISVAIVGSGPSGFYTAKYLQKLAFVHGIHIFERLPTPYGLVRSGVAPDHPEVKNVENDFAKVMEVGDDGKCGMEYFGNVNVGVDLHLDELREVYDVVVLAYGCSSDRPLKIKGSDLKGVMSAREFVAWYNSHPDYEYLTDEIRDILGGTDENEEPHAVLNKRVVIIGQGNVALDCARMLAKGGKGLYATDVASHFAEMPILKNGLKDISVVGRRGHVQGKFTIKELRELTKLAAEGHNTRFVVLSDELELGLNESSEEELKNSRPKLRIDKLLRTNATSRQSEEDNVKVNEEKKINLRFLLSPIEFLPKTSDRVSYVGSVVFERTRLEGKPGEQSAKGIGSKEELVADLVLTSIGYRGKPIRGLEKFFDNQNGIVRNENGKVSEGVYVSGWLKRGPSGIIGTNIGDARETVATISHDHEMGTLRSNKDINGAYKHILNLLDERKIGRVDWNAFMTIDKVEKDSERLRVKEQVREKITSKSDMLEIIR